ncbi:hypothetical protein BDY24DRAFT_390434 [Mrakia frigida]|uniref:uncharacterized protein n=1 Tax=Mrakia frigida TaxID=29902 RepID=UPI003FCC22F8
MLFPTTLLLPITLLLSSFVVSTNAVECKPFICHVKDCCKTADENLGCKFTDDLSFTGVSECSALISSDYLQEGRSSWRRMEG